MWRWSDGGQERRRCHLHPGQAPAAHPVGHRAVVRVNSDAYNALVDIYNESTPPMAQIASMLICNAAQRVRLVKEEEDDEAVRD